MPASARDAGDAGRRFNARLGRQVSWNTAVHHHGEVGAIGGEEIEVLERVAPNEQQVRSGPGFDAPQFAFGTEQGGVNGGDLPQDLGGREYLPSDPELDTLTIVMGA
jgi:hypothetical protein